MIFTIYIGYDTSYVIIKNKSPEFFQKFGGVFDHVGTRYLHQSMQIIADWCNNELGEECLFEVE